MPNVDVTKCARDKGKSEFGCLLWTFPYHFTSEAVMSAVRLGYGFWPLTKPNRISDLTG